MKGLLIRALLHFYPDCVVVSKDYLDKKHTVKAELEQEDNIIPRSKGISFAKTIENFKGMTGKARVTLLFRIAQVLDDSEKEAMLNYLNYRKEVNNEVSKKK